MKKWGGTSILIIILLILTLLGAINYFAKPLKKWQMANEQAEVVVPQIVDVAQEREDELPARLIDNLTASELVWQVLAVPVDVDDQLIEKSRQTEDRLTNQGLAEIESVVKTEIGLASDSMANLPATAPGSLIVFGEQISTTLATQFAQIVDSQYSTNSAKPWLAVDHEGGSVQRLSGQGFTILPSWQKVCQASPSAQLELATQTSHELKEVGIDLVLAPVIDVASRSAIMGNRICSGDSEKVASVSATFINSYLQAGLMPVIKHFPGIGGVTVDLHKQFGSVAVKPTDVLPFHTLLSQFPLLGVMSTHVGPEKNSQEVCSRSYSCVSELTSLYPKALVVSDALDMKAALYNSETENYDTPLPQIALESLLAGNDLLLFGPAVTIDELKTVAAYLQFAADRDPAIQERLKLAAEKIMSYKEMYQ